MKENKHIEKELLFKNNIKDITSISLDSNYKIEDNKIIGNFIIDGEYKIHELSINKEKFNFKIPFDYELDRNVNKDSVNLEIINFTYDYKKDELIVNIDYSVIGDIDEVIEFDSKELLDDYLRDKEVDVISERIEEIKDEVDDKLDEDIKKEEVTIEKQEDRNIEKEKNIDEIRKEETVSIVKNDKVAIIDNDIENIRVDENNIDINDVVSKVNNEDNFVSYKIYTIKENESIESIVMKYHTTIDDLKEYNDINNLNIGDKIILPCHE